MVESICLTRTFNESTPLYYQQRTRQLAKAAHWLAMQSLLTSTRNAKRTYAETWSCPCWRKQSSILLKGEQDVHALSWRQLRKNLGTTFAGMTSNWQLNVSESTQGFNLHVHRMKHTATLLWWDQGGTVMVWVMKWMACFIHTGGVPALGNKNKKVKLEFKNKWRYSVQVELSSCPKALGSAGPSRTQWCQWYHTPVIRKRLRQECDQE